MGVGETLGLIFAVFLILTAIAIAIWFYVFRTPTITTEVSCSKDSDCSDRSGATVFDQYQGLRCINGTCQNTACTSNSVCTARLPGSTCFGFGPEAGESGCVPLSCRTTDDCVPEGVDPRTADVVCVFDETEGSGVCVPSKPAGGGCYDMPLLTNSGGKCIVCSSSVTCPPGSYCEDGKCLRCGDTSDNLCTSKAGTRGAGPWGYCTVGDSCGTENFTCTRSINGQTIQLPNGDDLPNGLGLCLPNESECAFSWFNTTASADGPSTVLGGQCPDDKPYCGFNGKCLTTPVSSEDPDAAVVCGLLPGLGKDGMLSTSGGGIYDVTGLCSGRLVPAGSFADIENYTTDGQPFSGSQVCSGVDNPSKNCTCTTGRDGECPKGTFCQAFGAQSTTSTSELPGVCIISAGTGSFVPPPGQLGHFYPNSACIPNSKGIPVCTQLTSNNAGTSQAQGGPGDFCYTASQCLYNDKPQGKNNPFGSLNCVNNVCIGSN